MTTYLREQINTDNLDPVPGYASAIAMLRPEENPILSYLSLNLANLPAEGGMIPGGGQSFKHKEKVYRPARTTLGTTVDNSTQTIILAEKAAGPGDVVVMDTEAILLGDTSDYLTFTTCTRSHFTGAAAAHTAGDDVLILGKFQAEHANAPTAGAIAVPTTVTGYAGIMIDTVDVGDSARFMAEYSEGAYDKILAYTEETNLKQKHQLEHWLLYSKAQAGAGDTTAARPDGAFERIAATSYVDYSDTNLQYPDLQLQMRKAKRKGGRPRVFFCSDYQHDQISQWPISYVNLQPSDLAKAIFGAHVSSIRVGQDVIDIVSSDKMGKNSWLCSPEFVGVGPRRADRAFHLKPVGVLGDYEQVMSIGEYCVCVQNPYAHVWGTSVKFGT